MLKEQPGTLKSGSKSSALIEGCLPTGAFGFSRKTSEGKYLCCSSQRRQVTPRDEEDRSRNSAQRSEAVTGRGLEFVDAPLGFVLDSRIQRRLFLLVGPLRMYRNSADETLVVCEAFT